jgi:hypothetical protein
MDVLSMNFWSLLAPEALLFVIYDSGSAFGSFGFRRFCFSEFAFDDELPKMGNRNTGTHTSV